jgi:hypothetical protein
LPPEFAAFFGVQGRRSAKADPTLNQRQGLQNHPS